MKMGYRHIFSFDSRDPRSSRLHSCFPRMIPHSIGRRRMQKPIGSLRSQLNGIVESLQDKSILITGSSGFLAKVFVEKVLRVQPNVNRLFLVLRAADTKSASQRMHKEVLGKDLFKVLKEKHGEGYDEFITNKVIPVPGDISYQNLGLKNLDVKEQILNEIDIIVNVAANTNFDERYDVALGTNTYGAKNILEFSKRCKKLEMLLHVSTAYVCGEQSGLLLEKGFQMGETLNGTPGLDIEQERKLVEETLDQLKSQNATMEQETLAMKELGLTRARYYGWPNTYVFTKSMGEMIIGHLREKLPIVILRPTIITSTYKEPFPGWVEGVRTIDSFGVAYGKGKLTSILGGADSILDLIPGDMVVNAMIAAMVAHANQDAEFIYHASSSLSNPMNSSMFRDFGYQYFSKHPWIDKNGKPIKVHKAVLFDTMDSFRRHVLLTYMLPLKGLQLVNVALCNSFHGKWSDLNRKISVVMRLVELYKPYLFFKGIFDEVNLENLRSKMKEIDADTDTFYFDPKVINWEEYFMNIHLPGIIKYVF